MMRSASRLFLAVLVCGFAAGAGPVASAADSGSSPASRPTPVLTGDPAAAGLGGQPLSTSEQLQLGRRRIGEEQTVRPRNPGAVEDAPPVPADVDSSAAEAPIEPAPQAAPANAPPVALPFAFGPGSGRRSAMHDRLRQKRLYRVQQMRQSAEQKGDSQGVERAQYLEGMVNELHNQGLFNFGQKVMSAMQDGKLQGLMGGASGSAPASGSAEMPEADLGSSAPLPDVDLGESAPLPTDDASPSTDAQKSPGTGPQLSPSPAPEDGGDAPPVKQ